jgi:hypothetical protein
MWVVGNYNLPYARQDINVAIENYHAIWKPPFIPPRVYSTGDVWIGQCVH